MLMKLYPLYDKLWKSWLLKRTDGSFENNNVLTSFVSTGGGAVMCTWRGWKSCVSSVNDHKIGLGSYV